MAKPLPLIMSITDAFDWRSVTSFFVCEKMKSVF